MIEDKVESVIQRHIKELAKKQEDMILACYKKQKGFISFEKSKKFIEVRAFVINGEDKGTDYLFKGKVILSISPPSFDFEGRNCKATINFKEH